MKHKKRILYGFILLLCCLSGCADQTAPPTATTGVEPSATAPLPPTSTPAPPATPTSGPTDTPEPPPPPTPSDAPAPVEASPGQRLQPDDLTYLGAFRLPDWPDEEIGWAWSGAALAYYPDGDPDGPDDGHPGSLFGTGHDWNQHVAEISIPALVNAPGQNLDELNTATILQGFQDVRAGLFDWPLEIPRAGLAYLPPQGEQAMNKDALAGCGDAPAGCGDALTGRLFFAWAQHMGEGDTGPTHGWCELDLAHPQTAGLWRVGEHWNYVTGDYLFPIPPAWAEAHTPGLRLATGRFRDGGQGGMGPSLFAIGPWNQGNPPPPGATLPATPLLRYGSVYQENPATLDGYHPSDEWSGGAWLTAGDKAAAVFVGTKGQGECWYGFANGVVWPEEGPYPPVPDPPNDDRGWWSTRFVGQMLFYDPADLAAVARGDLAPDQPQPYAVMELDPYLYHVDGPQQLHHVGAASFDPQRGILYVLEPFGDGDKPLVHAWRID